MFGAHVCVMITTNARAYVLDNRSDSQPILTLRLFDRVIFFTVYYLLRNGNRNCITGDFGRKKITVI